MIEIPANTTNCFVVTVEPIVPGKRISVRIRDEFRKSNPIGFVINLDKQEGLELLESVFKHLALDVFEQQKGLL